MPPTNAKNLSLNPAVSDLGLGDMLTQQRDDLTEEEKRRKLLAGGSIDPLNPAVQALFGGAGGGY